MCSRRSLFLMGLPAAALAAPPANDDIAGRIDLTIPDVQSGTNVEATTVANRAQLAGRHAGRLPAERHDRTRRRQARQERLVPVHRDRGLRHALDQPVRLRHRPRRVQRQLEQRPRARGVQRRHRRRRPAAGSRDDGALRRAGQVYYVQTRRMLWWVRPARGLVLPHDLATARQRSRAGAETTSAQHARLTASPRAPSNDRRRTPDVYQRRRYPRLREDRLVPLHGPRGRGRDDHGRPASAPWSRSTARVPSRAARSLREAAPRR